MKPLKLSLLVLGLAWHAAWAASGALDAASFVIDAERSGPLQPTHPNAHRYGAPWISVNARTQTLTIYDGWGRETRRYQVSTASRGLGEQEGSYQTPRGWHQVCEKIGDGVEENTIIFHRSATPWKYTPELHREYPNKDWILTRILWLCGMEPGKNKGGSVDSYDRAIYIHGAGAHVPFGSPSSLGCIRMRNREVVELFATTPLGTDVVIEEEQ